MIYSTVSVKKKKNNDDNNADHKNGVIVSLAKDWIEAE